MKIFQSADACRNWVISQKEANKHVGFVPTMGALHAGHQSLVERSVKENDRTIVSIFVNPTQFNDKNDLKNYPRTPEEDLEMLKVSGCDACFMPAYDEVYGNSEPVEEYNLQGLDKMMEGQHRPGHFKGVVMVVHRLFTIIPATQAYFGQKDFQQQAIIRQLVHQLNLPIEIVTCPIIRESDGLAMSSRNVLLTEDHRKAAPQIYKALSASVSLKDRMSIEEVKKQVIQQINNHPLLSVEYYEIVNDFNLNPVHSWDEKHGIFGCIAVHAGGVRLIDNVRYNS